MTTTRGNTSHGTILELPGYRKASRKLELSPNASASQKRDYFLKVFKVPPNADVLIQNRMAPTVEQLFNIDGPNSGATVSQGDSATIGVFRLLQFNASCTNCENIFKAVVFLHTRLRDKAYVEDESFQFGSTKDSSLFKDLAAELSSAEPSLRGVTPQALASLYNRIIQERKALDDFLEAATGVTWKDTWMSSMMKEIMDAERYLRERELQQQQAKTDAKGKQVTDAEAFKRQCTVTTLSALTGQKRALEGDIEEGSSDEGDIDDEPTMQPQPASSVVSVCHQASSASTSQMHTRRLSSASDSTDSDVLQHTGDHALGSTRLTSQFKRRLITMDAARWSALVARLDQLEAQNRQLRVEQMQSTRSIQRSINGVDDELSALRRQNILLESQLDLVRSQVNMLQDRLRTVEQDSLRFGRRLRDMDNKIVGLEYANMLKTLFP